jgi:hypothetical protein
VLAYSYNPATTPATPSAAPIATFMNASLTLGSNLAIESDNSRVLVTLLGSNQLLVIDNTGAPALAMSSPFTLGAAATQPAGIGLAANGANVFAYISKQAPGAVATIAAVPTGATETGNTVTITTTAAHGFVSGESVTIAGVALAGYNGTFTVTVASPTTFTYTDPTAGLVPSGGGTATPSNDGVDVENVTNVGFSAVAGSISTVTQIVLPGGATPDAVAVDPSATNVFVTLTGTQQFDVITNTAMPAELVPGTQFNLPDPTAAAADTPGGVAIPPVVSGTVLAYITGMNTDEIDVLTDVNPPRLSTAPATNPFGVTGGSAPGRIQNIPIPQ